MANPNIHHLQALFNNQHTGEPSTPWLPYESTNKATNQFVLFQQFMQQTFGSLDWDTGQLRQDGLRPRKALNLCSLSFRALIFVSTFYICSSMNCSDLNNKQSFQFDSWISKNVILGHELFYLLFKISIQAPDPHFSPTPRDSTCIVHFSWRQVYALLLKSSI